MDLSTAAVIVHTTTITSRALSLITRPLIIRISWPCNEAKTSQTIWWIVPFQIEMYAPSCYAKMQFIRTSLQGILSKCIIYLLHHPSGVNAVNANHRNFSNFSNSSFAVILNSGSVSQQPKRRALCSSGTLSADMGCKSSSIRLLLRSVPTSGYWENGGCLCTVCRRKQSTKSNDHHGG